MLATLNLAQDSEISPSTVTCQLLKLFRSCFGSHDVKIFWIQLLCPNENWQSCCRIPGPLALTVFLSLLLECSVNLGYRGCVVDVLAEVGIPLSVVSILKVGSFCNGLLQ